MAGAFQSDTFQSDTFQEDAGSSVTRTASDAVTTSDAATRSQVLVRSATDAITTSDLATIGNFAAASDTVTVSSTAARVTIATRAATETVTTSDAVTRIASKPRSMSDAVTTSDVATRLSAHPRTTSDAVTTSDTATVIGTSLHRTAADAVAAGDSVRTNHQSFMASDAVVVGDLVRTSHPMIGVSDAVIARITDNTHLVPFAPGSVIYIAGVNVTKADGDPMMFSTARFESAVNGVAGKATFRLRDDAGTASYRTGDSLQLVIDGNPVWTGFVQSVTRVYVFPALNVDDFGPTRFFDITGVDLNILFEKRIVFNQTTPKNVLAPLYGHFTPDTTAIADLLGNWLDLSGDGLDTSTGVIGVGDINQDQDARAWEGSDQWGQAMTSIASLPAAIFYIRPNWQFAYVDTDTPDAPFGLSDQPDGVTSKGYREMEVLLDGTNLANDVMAWGIGYGSTVPVFDRDEDATSITDHGVWQLGQVTFGIYRQATIDRVVDSIINGSPDHHRGTKDDREAVTVTTFEPGFLPAQKLLFESNVFGYSKVLPIRRMVVTFPTPDTPKYELMLSQEIDTPWSFFDPFRWQLPQLPSLPPFPPWPPFPQPGVSGGCTDAICGITDFFNRTDESEWGTASSGLEWDIAGGDGFSVSNAGIITLHDGETSNSPFANIRTVKFASGVVTAQITFDAGSPDPDRGVSFGGDSDTDGVDLVLATNGDFSLFTYNDADTVSTAIDPSLPFSMRFEITGGNVQARVWQASDPEPLTWDATLAILVDELTSDLFLSASAGPPTGFDDLTVAFTNLDASDLNACSLFGFDNFNRVTTGSWGTSSSSVSWTTVGSGAGDIDVNNGFGKLEQDGGLFTSGQFGAITTDRPESWSTDFDMLATFRIDALPDVGWDGTNWFCGIRDEAHTGAVADQQVAFAQRDPANGNGDSLTFVRGNGDSNVVVSFPWTLNVNYKVRWVRSGADHQITVWQAANPEPSTPSISSTAYEFVADRFVVYQTDPTRHFITDPAADLRIWWDSIDFDYAGKPCYVGVPPEPATGGGPSFGPTYEAATRIDATHYQLSRTTVSGSVSVYVGSPGALLIPTTDYTVDTSTGVVTLVTPITDPATVVQATYTAAGPLPVAFPSGVIAQFPGTGPNTQAAFTSLCSNLAYSVIEIADGTYYGWNLSMRINRGAANPLGIRPATGANVKFDGTGALAGYGFMNLGSNVLASGFPSFVTDYITWDPAGTGGTFTIQNYPIGHTGLILLGWTDHVTVNGFNVVNCSGSGGSFSHCLYINSDHNDVPLNAGHHATNTTANNWVIAGDAGRTLNAMQTFHNPNVIGLTMRDWTVDRVNRWAFLYGDASGIVLDGWNGTNCNATIDSPTISGSDHATGTVSNCNGHGSCGTIASGTSPWVNTGITDGGGNTP